MIFNYFTQPRGYLLIKHENNESTFLNGFLDSGARWTKNPHMARKFNTKFEVDTIMEGLRAKKALYDMTIEEY